MTTDFRPYITMALPITDFSKHGCPGFLFDEIRKWQQNPDLGPGDDFVIYPDDVSWDSNDPRIIRLKWVAP